MSSLGRYHLFLDTFRLQTGVAQGYISLMIEPLRASGIGAAQSRRARYPPGVVAALSVFAATLLIVSTYSVFSQTVDEGEHLAAGMEWLDGGSYTYRPINPPLARVAVALGPYLAGARSQGRASVWTEGKLLLEYQGHYQRTLTLARLGILPFFWLTCFVLWRFIARHCGPWHAALAILLFAFCPPVLANASVATTDLPFAAMFLCAVVAFWNFLRQPRASSALVSGCVIALALLCKLSGLPYLLVVCGGLYIFLRIEKRAAPSWKYLCIAGVALALTIWAGYRFSIGPILDLDHVNEIEMAHLRKLPGGLARIFFWQGVPAPEFFKGLAQTFSLLQKKRPAYLLGQTYLGGRWYFYPVAIAVKTPIPLLLLAVVGTVRALVLPRVPASRFALIGVAGPLLVAMISSVNMGLRHVLVIYPFLAMLGAYGFFWLWQMGVSRASIVASRAIVALLLVWTVLTCVRAAPDFIPYFNEAAAPYGSRILVDSDFDWGQDLKRLSSVLQQNHVDFIWIAYEGSADLTLHGLPPAQLLLPRQRPAGWVAVSEFFIRTAPRDYGWVENYKPERVVGKTIRLYHFDIAPKD